MEFLIPVLSPNIDVKEVQVLTILKKCELFWDGDVTTKKMDQRCTMAYYSHHNLWRGSDFPKETWSSFLKSWWSYFQIGNLDKVTQ